MNANQQIVPGLSISASGQATVDPSMHEVLFDLAIALESPTGLPVDMEHVVGALVLAGRKGELDTGEALSAEDASIVSRLVPHVRAVFALYGGKLGQED